MGCIQPFAGVMAWQCVSVTQASPLTPQALAFTPLAARLLPGYVSGPAIMHPYAAAAVALVGAVQWWVAGLASPVSIIKVGRLGMHGVFVRVIVPLASPSEGLARQQRLGAGVARLHHQDDWVYLVTQSRLCSY